MSSEVQIAAAAAELLRGDQEAVLTRASSNPAFASRLAEAVAEQLGATIDAELGHPEPTWIVGQEAIRRLARTPGVDGDLVATAFVRAVTLVDRAGPADGLGQRAAMWLAADHPAVIRSAFRNEQLHPFHRPRHLFTALFLCPGPLGARWLPELIRHDDVAVSFATQDMLLRGTLPRWPDEDWGPRLEAAAQPGVPTSNLLTFLFWNREQCPPAIVAPAAVRLVAAHIADETDQRFREAAAWLATLRTGDPVADVALFGWDVPASQRPALRLLLELSGPAESARPVVDAAFAAGLIDAATHAALAAPVRRPDWADGDVPWTIEPIDEVHAIDLHGGALAAGDPIWVSESGAPVELCVPPGRYEARVIRATHPLHGRRNAALEVLIDANAEVVRWEAAPGMNDGEPFIVENGIAVVGDPHYATRTNDVDPDFGDRTWAGRYSDAEGGALAAYVSPQHHAVRSWVGYDAALRPVRLVSELGVLDDLDPTRRSLRRSALRPPAARSRRARARPRSGRGPGRPARSPVGSRGG